MRIFVNSREKQSTTVLSFTTITLWSAPTMLAVLSKDFYSGHLVCNLFMIAEVPVILVPASVNKILFLKHQTADLNANQFL